ncbi:Holliday junction branch migration protein RuvA [Peptostreptococcus faecalis]|uniref:Holliday junction branch migration protein RuvA n=1 Tax=Peptostreptococcus faecalis TaxID=2045015 RepID=UPI000C7AD6D1|nr:Holliday junction branch migration protein RuvA [Peptostreptococcus faecalis]
MIGYIKGIVEDVGIDFIIVENNGVGFKLNVSSNTISQLSLGEEVKIYSKMIVREDDISLCGFYSEQEQEMFNLLTSVSKIGTKVGLSILSFATPNQLYKYIRNADTASLSKAPGVGKKTAERIVLELKDKVNKIAIDEDDFENEQNIVDSKQVSNSEEEAIEALMSLGYSKQESQEAVYFVKQPGMETEDIVKKSLEYIMKSSIKF